MFDLSFPGKILIDNSVDLRSVVFAAYDYDMMIPLLPLVHSTSSLKVENARQKDRDKFLSWVSF